MDCKAVFLELERRGFSAHTAFKLTLAHYVHVNGHSYDATTMKHFAKLVMDRLR